MVKSLQGRGVLVTRPEAQSKALCKMIEFTGGSAIAFPTLVISEVQNPEKVINHLKQIVDYDWLFFISANAVHYAARLLGGAFQLSGRIKVAAIGEATRQALSAYGVKTDIIPLKNSHTEALLAHPDLQNMAQKKCLIIRGEGGREKLAEGLRNHGATVVYAEVYRRACPEVDVHPLISRWRNGEIDCVIVTSGEALMNLITLLGMDGQCFLKNTPLVTVSERIKKMAVDAGIRQVVVSKQPGNESLLAVLVEQSNRSLNTL